MVFYYKIRGGKCRNAHSHITLTSEDITCYVGRDKHENEYLIQYGWPGDIWFHVEGLSSAHVYFRLDCFASSNVNPHVRGLLGKLPIDDLPAESVEDMCQIVKHNSIAGCKLASCKIVYTPHSNLKKRFDMADGSVTYHDTKLQRFRRCDKDRKRVKELESTKSADLTIDYYEAMKANERKLIDYKKYLRKNPQKANSMDIYDPVLSDLRGQKAKAKRQGDASSGLDSGLAALEELALGGGAGGSSNSNYNRLSGLANNEASQEENEPDRSHLPVWQREDHERLEAHGSDETLQFLLARGYTMAEISSALGEKATPIKLPPSVALEKLWNEKTTDTDENNTTHEKDLDAEFSARLYEARNEEREVLEAIYGEDDHASFGWRQNINTTKEDNNEDQDPSKPFSFDLALPVPGYEPPPRYEYPPPLKLEVYVDHNISCYPFGNDEEETPIQPPVLAVVGGGLPAKLLRELTKQLRACALERSLEVEPGQPQLFDLLQSTGELAEALVQEESQQLEEEERQRKQQRAKEEREQLKAEAERLGVVETTVTKLTFRSEADRRAYAQSIVSSKGLGGW